MTFLSSPKHHTGISGDALSLVCMPWTQINAEVHSSTRRLQSVVVAVKTKWEVRLT